MYTMLFMCSTRNIKMNPTIPIHGHYYLIGEADKQIMSKKMK